MRTSDKDHVIQKADNQIFGVDFHDFLQKEQTETMVELATEFGITVGDVRKLKKQLERS